MDWHSMSTEKVLEYFQTDSDNGLSIEQVEKNKQTYGNNRLKEKNKKTYFQKFIEQFKDTMIIILLIAAAISFGVALYSGHKGELFEPLLILVIVVINAGVGVIQESKAEKALEALKSLSAPHAKVIRNGIEQIIEAYDVVPGDIIRLEAGDYIPADARLIKSTSLKCDESALTGESLPAEKDSSKVVDKKAPLGDRENMIFSACSVTYGTGLAVVVATGMETQMGKIADLLNNEEKNMTPLQKKLADLGKYLGAAAIFACVIIFIVGVIDGINLLEIFMTSVSLAVSAIPEGLPVIVTVVLSIGVQKMVKRNAIIRRLPAVETLGSASVICSDKTGTLTQNKMTVIKSYCDNNLQEENISDNCSNDTKNLLKFAALCCDGSVNFENGKEIHIGDPTETSIVLTAHKNGMIKQEINKENPRIGEIPFDSDRKLMSTINKINGKNIVIVKGAFDVLKNRCIEGNIKEAEKVCDKMSSEALRVLAVGYKEIDEVPSTLKTNEIEKNLIFMGLLGIIDPPRKEAAQAVKLCKSAGIKPVMITGDHIVTASAIAKQLGILNEGELAITGSELSELNESVLTQNIRKISVYARVSPEDKIRIVKTWQSIGEVVAMTGDGVNDAPALKASDIGCAMGITGTDVAKGAADMTLTDDNFATIVEAIKEGRGIYSNIKKVVGFLLGTNIGEVLTVFFAMLIWKKSPLISIQLLWINLVTDSMPAIALGMESVENDIMNRSPKPRNEGLFAKGFGIRIILQGIMFAAITLIGFYWGIKETGDLSAGQTMAFFVLSLSQIVQSFNMRSDHSLFKVGFFSNRSLNIAALVSVFLIMIVMFTPISVLFEISKLDIALYIKGVFLAFIPLLVMEISKNIGLIKVE